MKKDKCKVNSEKPGKTPRERERDLNFLCMEYGTLGTIFIGAETLEGSKRDLIGRPLETIGR